MWVRSRIYAPGLAFYVSDDYTCYHLKSRLKAGGGCPDPVDHASEADAIPEHPRNSWRESLWPANHSVRQPWSWQKSRCPSQDPFQPMAWRRRHPKKAKSTTPFGMIGVAGSNGSHHLRFSRPEVNLLLRHRCSQAARATILLRVRRSDPADSGDPLKGSCHGPSAPSGPPGENTGQWPGRRNITRDRPLP